MNPQKRTRRSDTDGDDGVADGGVLSGGGGEGGALGRARLRPAAGTRVVLARKIQIDDGDGGKRWLMGCFEAVVAPHPLLEADGGDDCVRLRQGDDEWDEAPCNIYELLCSASVGTRCEGIRCSQFASGPQQHAFRRKCQHAVAQTRPRPTRAGCTYAGEQSLPTERGGHPQPRHRAGGEGGDGGDPQLQHYHLRQVDSNPANDEFHSMYCGHQHSTTTTATTTTTTTTTTTGTARNLSLECQLLSKIIRSNIYNATAYAATTKTDVKQASKAPNTSLLTRELADKAKALAEQLHRTQKKLLYQKRQRALERLAAAQCEEEDQSLVRTGTGLDGGALAGSAAVVLDVVNAVLDPCVSQYFNKASKTPEQAEAGVAIFVNARRNMQSFNNFKSKHGFRFSPEAFAFALGVFASMSSKDVFDLRKYKPSPADIKRESLTVWY